jgi:hypothetical protein
MADEHQLRWGRVLSVVAAGLVVVHGFILLVYSSWGPIFGEIIFVPVLVAILLLALGLLAAAIKRFRSRAWFVVGGAAIFLLTSVPLFPFAWYVRSLSFRSLASRAQPLVDSIHAYERENGRPPENLNAIVVPKSLGLPDFEYLSGDDAESFDNPWILELPVSTGMINFDRFFYFPRQNYSRDMERIGRWAYQHE